MSGLLSSTSPLGGFRGPSPSYFQQIIQLLVQAQRKPLSLIKVQKDDLVLRQAVYNDTRALLVSLQDVATGLKSSTDSVFGLRTVLISDTTILGGTAAPWAPAGIYDITISSLALAHRVRSDRQLWVDQPLDLSGNFVIGGSNTRSATSVVTVPNTVTNFGALAPASGQKELGSGTYYVEVRNNGGSGANADWEFRVLDADGKAVSVYDATQNNGNLTSAWQDIDDAIAISTANKFDTRRGMEIIFGNDPNKYKEAFKGATGNYLSSPGPAAEVSYTALGATVTVDTADSLLAIRDKINNATYAEGNQVTASIVDNYLILEGKYTGRSIQAADPPGGGKILETLGVLQPSGNFKNVLQSAQSASFTVNGLSLTRRVNTGLTDVIQGLTLDLLKAGTATLEVKQDAESIQGQIQSFLDKLNELLKQIKDKTAVSGSQETKVYARAPLAGDFSLYGLRSNLYSLVLAKVSGQPTGAPDQLADVGVKLGDDLSFSIADVSKLEAELARNDKDVESLLDKVMQSVLAKLDPFVKDTTGIVDTRLKGLADRIQAIDLRTGRLEKQIERREEQLIAQYAKLLQQAALFQGQGSLFFGAGFDLFA